MFFIEFLHLAHVGEWVNISHEAIHHFLPETVVDIVHTTGLDIVTLVTGSTLVVVGFYLKRMEQKAQAKQESEQKGPQ